MTRGHRQLRQEVLRLVETARSGDKLSYDRLFRLIYSGLRTFIALSVKNPQQVEDLTQETCLKIHRAWHSFNGENFHAWMLTIARNVMRDAHRRSKVRPDESNQAAADLDWNLFAGSSKTDANINAQQAFASLKEEYRSALHAVAFSGEELEDFAKSEAITINAARIRMSRARREFASELLQLAS